MAEPSWQDLWNIFKTTAQEVRPSLLFFEGSVMDALAAGTASVGTMILARVANRFLANFLDGSRGVDLVDLAADRGVVADQGVAAVGSLTFSRVSAALGGGVINHGFRVSTDADPITGLTITVTTDEDVIFNATDLVKVVTCKAAVTGVQGNVAENTLVRPIDALFDPSIVVTNSSRLAGGSEPEPDEDLRDRVRGFFLTQARGTIDAIDFAARTVSGVRRVSVTVDDSGVVTVYVADAQGNSNEAMASAVAKVLESWRAAGDLVYVSTGLLMEIPISLALTVRSNVSVGALLNDIRKAVVARVGRLNPGETLYRDMIASAVRDVDKHGIIAVQVVSPSVNITPEIHASIRTTISGVTFV